MEVEFKSQSEIVETLILENTEKDDNMVKMEELVRKMDESRKKTINRAHSMKKKYQHLREIHDTLQNVVANQKIALNEFKSMTSDVSHM